MTYLDPSLERIPGTTYHTYQISYFEEGYPLYYFRGYKFTGVDPETGDPTFADLDGDGEITADGDRTYIGDAMPDFTFGLTMTAAWKGFDLTVFAAGSVGNDISMLLIVPTRPRLTCLKRYSMTTVGQPTIMLVQYLVQVLQTWISTSRLML